MQLLNKKKEVAVRIWMHKVSTVGIMFLSIVLLYLAKEYDLSDHNAVTYLLSKWYIALFMVIYSIMLCIHCSNELREIIIDYVRHKNLKKILLVATEFFFSFLNILVAVSLVTSISNHWGS